MRQECKKLGKWVKLEFFGLLTTTRSDLIYPKEAEKSSFGKTSGFYPSYFGRLEHPLSKLWMVFCCIVNGGNFWLIARPGLELLNNVNALKIEICWWILWLRIKLRGYIFQTEERLQIRDSRREVTLRTLSKSSWPAFKQWNTKLYSYLEAFKPR